MTGETSKPSPEPRETSRGLPIVTDSTVKTVWEAYADPSKWSAHLEGVSQRLQDENPALTAHIEQLVDLYPLEQHDHLFQTILGVVAVLESQAEINLLADQFGPDTPE